MNWKSLITVLLVAFLWSCGSVEFETKDGKKVPTSFKFEGLVEVSANEFLKASKRELQSYFDNGKRLADLDDATFSMRRLLLERGFAEAQVAFDVPSNESSEDVVTFRVTEGTQYWFGEFEYEGVDPSRIELVKKYFDFPGSGILGTGRTFYRTSAIKSSTTALESYYIAEGHVDVLVEWGTEKSKEVEDEFLTKIKVKEGPQFHIGKIELVSSEAIVDLEVIQEHLKGYSGRLFTPTNLVEAQSWVKGKLAAKGRLLAKINRSVAVDRESKTVDVNLQLNAGPILKLQDINLKNHDRTDPEFILERLRLKSGEILKRSELDDAINRLYATGLFENVKFTTESEKPTDDIALTNLNLELSELDARSLDVEGGWGSYELLRGGVRFRDRNVLGIGRDFESALRGSFKHIGADLRFLDPYTLGRKNILRASVGVQRRDFRAYVSESIDARVSVRRRINSRTDIEGGYRFRIADASDISSSEDGSEDSSFITSAIYFRFEYDGRNDFLVPTKGGRIVLNLTWSATELGASRDFFGINLRGSYLVELGKGTVLAFGSQLETRHVLDGGGTLPVQERFFLGGENTIRSFREAELGPTGINGDPVGGLTSVQGHVELRQKLYGDLHCALFYDVGSVSRDSFSATEFGHGVGFGLRYLLPFGPARLDFAYNPGATFAAKRDWAIHFGFGFSF